MHACMQVKSAFIQHLRMESQRHVCLNACMRARRSSVREDMPACAATRCVCLCACMHAGGGTSVRSPVTWQTGGTAGATRVVGPVPAGADGRHPGVYAHTQVGPVCVQRCKPGHTRLRVHIHLRIVAHQMPPNARCSGRLSGRKPNRPRRSSRPVDPHVPTGGCNDTKLHAYIGRLSMPALRWDRPSKTTLQHHQLLPPADPIQCTPIMPTTNVGS